MSNVNIKVLVKKLIGKYGANNPFILCEALGITVRFKDLGNVRGMYQHYFRKKMIYINCNISPAVQRRVCAHELGHALLHKKINTGFYDIFNSIYRQV